MTSSNVERKLRYQHVYDLVLAIMADRDLKPGDRLPSTTELAAIAQVSTISVRRALDELERAGKIARRQGLGTFVAQARIADDSAGPRALLHTLLDEDGELPAATTTLLSIGVGMPAPSVAGALGLHLGQPVWEIWRRRGFGDDDTLLERAVLPLCRVPAIDRELLAQGGSLYRFLEERYQLKQDYTEKTIEVETAGGWEAAHLGVDVGEPVVRLRGVSFDAEGGAFDFFQQCCSARRFTFYAAGRTHHRLLGHSGPSNWSVAPLSAL